MAKTECLKLTRDHGEPWGFRLQGGKDFSCPLTIVRVNKGSSAEKSGLKVGHCVLSVNGVDTLGFTHKDALEAIVKAEDNLEFMVKFLELGPLWKGNRSRPVSQIAVMEPDIKDAQLFHLDPPLVVAHPGTTDAMGGSEAHIENQNPNLETVVGNVDSLPTVEFPILAKEQPEQPIQPEQPKEPIPSLPEQLEQLPTQPELPIQPEQLEPPIPIQPEQPEQQTTSQPEPQFSVQPEQPEHAIQCPADQLPVPVDIQRSPSPLSCSPHHQGMVQEASEAQIFEESQTASHDEALFESVYRSNSGEQGLNPDQQRSTHPVLTEDSKDHALELLKRKLPHEHHSIQSELFLHPLDALPVSRVETPIEPLIETSPLDLENFPPPSRDFKIINMTTGDEVCGDQLVHETEHPHAPLNPPPNPILEEVPQPRQPSPFKPPHETVPNLQKPFCSVLGYDKPQVVHPYQPINTTVNQQYIPGFVVSKETKTPDRPIRHSFLEEKYTEDEIAETLTSQAEILNTGVIGVNFKKYQKTYDGSHSEVLRMLQEMS